MIALVVTACLMEEIGRVHAGNDGKDHQDDNPPDDNPQDDNPPDDDRTDYNETAEEYAPIITVPGAVSAFTQDMYASLSPLTNNSLFSPLSVHAALSMLAWGATGNTSTSMRETLYLFDIDDPYQEYQELIQSLKQITDIDLVMANGIWVNPSVKIKEEYKKFVTDYFKAKSDNFNLNDTNGPEFQINNWVTSSTNNTITSLLQRGTITKDTALILINSLFLKASWQSPFDQSKTTKGDFTTQDGTNVTTDFMIKTDTSFQVKTYDEADVVRIPFKNNTYALYIMLPNSKHDLTELEYLDHYSGNDGFLEGFEMTKLNLALPKFKLTATLNLNEALQEMGMANPFTDDATFSGISDVHLELNNVIQKATFEVTEYGTIASSSTSVDLSTKSGNKATDFRVNKPFMFFIRDDYRELILFEGKLSDPRETTIDLA